MDSFHALVSVNLFLTVYREFPCSGFWKLAFSAYREIPSSGAGEFLFIVDEENFPALVSGSVLFIAYWEILRVAEIILLIVMRVSLVYYPRLSN
jgi:hypothetical protein